MKTRKPVAFDGAVVICDDGAVFKRLPVYEKGRKTTKRMWQEADPVPGTARALEVAQAMATQVRPKTGDT